MDTREFHDDDVEQRIPDPINFAVLDKLPVHTVIKYSRMPPRWRERIVIGSKLWYCDHCAKGIAPGIKAVSMEGAANKVLGKMHLWCYAEENK